MARTDTPPLRAPHEKSPLQRTRQAAIPPGARSRQALRLTAAAALGRFELQVCSRCHAVQYPPREVCHQCLADALRWQSVSPSGRLLVSTHLHHSNDVYFRERLPWRIGTVRLDAGPNVVAHVHGECQDHEPVTLSLKLDRSGQAVMVALPIDASPNMRDDPVVRETSCSPHLRRALVTDAKNPVGQATVKALVDAGASLVFAGDPRVWEPQADYDSLCRHPQVRSQSLDVTDSDSVETAAASIGGKVDIMVCTHDYQRPGGILMSRDINRMRDALDVNCLGTIRLAQEFGPAMAARAADGIRNAAAWVNVLSIYAHINRASYGTWSVSQAAALSVSQCLRSEFAASGVRVVNVFTGPIEAAWEQLTPPPLVKPQAIAHQVVSALEQGLEDSSVGDVAREFLNRLLDNPKGLERDTL